MISNHRTLLVQRSLHKYECLWGMEARVGIQVSRREFHTRIYLDYTRVEFIFCFKK